jgi:hypothetical protein
MEAENSKEIIILGIKVYLWYKQGNTPNYREKPARATAKTKGAAGQRFYWRPYGLNVG